MTRNHRIGGLESTVSPEEVLGNVFHFDPTLNCFNPRDDDAYGNDGGASSSPDNSPFVLSPWNNIASSSSPYKNSTWIVKSPPMNHLDGPRCGLIGSIVREEGHIYSLATSRDLLYTGSDSKNIRVWKDLKEYSAFKSGSGLVKAIVISSGGKIFTGHQDGKIRIWKFSAKNPAIHRRFGSLPTAKDSLKSSLNPKNFVDVRRKRNVLKIKHYDTVSCLSLDRESGLLYSGSWDKTVKVWRISDFKCVESIAAHSDAVNSVVAGFNDLIFTGSADGTVKAWRRELQGGNLRHFLMQLLLQHENAVTALAVNVAAAVVYCGSSDGLLNTWEMEKQRLCQGGILRGHKLAVLCVAVAGNLVFSGGADMSICVWQRDGAGIHTCLSVLTGHNGPVKCLAVEKDSVGREGEDHEEDEDRRWTLYSGSLDKSVKVWTVAEARSLFTATK